MEFLNCAIPAWLERKPLRLASNIASYHHVGLVFWVSAIIEEHCKFGHNCHPSAGWVKYKGLAEKQFVHETVSHINEYVRGSVHTQGIENFWSLLNAPEPRGMPVQRQIKGAPVLSSKSIAKSVPDRINSILL